MKKVFAILFLSLYLNNLLGYYIIFKTLQYQVRKEVKTAIKEGVPEHDLQLITVKRGQEGLLQWLDDHEFRYMGNMYDVVRYYCRNDSAFYSCVTDTQEEMLFRNLDAYVATQSTTQNLPQKAATRLQGMDTQYVPLMQFLLHCELEEYPFQYKSVPNAPSFTPDVPTPPPRVT